jgi:hypothetical protein
MSKRTWYISPKNEAANSCTMELVEGDNERVTKQKVSEKNPGKKEVISDEFLVEVDSYEDIKRMREFCKSKSLKYKVYVRESPGAKINHWIGDTDPKRKSPKVKLVKASTL